MESISYLEDNISRRKKTIEKLYAEIEELKSYNRRDRAEIEARQKLDMEADKKIFFDSLGLSEDEDLRGVFVIFNEKLEYVETKRLKDFGCPLVDMNESVNFNKKMDSFEKYLRQNKLYGNSADAFKGKPLRWYQKAFDKMLLSFGDWKVDENGILIDSEW